MAYITLTLLQITIKKHGQIILKKIIIGQLKTVKTDTSQAEIWTKLTSEKRNFTGGGLCLYGFFSEQKPVHSVQGKWAIQQKAAVFLD